MAYPGLIRSAMALVAMAVMYASSVQYLRSHPELVRTVSHQATEWRVTSHR